jgi:hypothetical protein
VAFNEGHFIMNEYSKPFWLKVLTISDDNPVRSNTYPLNWTSYLSRFLLSNVYSKSFGIFSLELIELIIY